MQLYTIADITPGGFATPLSATSVKAVWINLFASGTTIRVGDSSVSATRGVPVSTTGSPTQIPRCDFNQGGYDLSKVYVFGTGGDKVSITYGS